MPGSDFVEVETAALQVSPGNETHLHAFATDAGRARRHARRPLYLRTSPEFACKKLLAAGERRIVEFAKVFRNRERGALHHPEFTLVEWYRAGEPYETLMGDCAACCAPRREAAGTRQLTFRGRSADPFAEPERLSVAEAFDRFAGIDLLATLPRRGAGPRRPCARRAGAQASALPTTIPGATFSAACWSSESSLISASAAPLFSTNIRQCRRRWRGRRRSDPRVAERFELYVCGVELANGFGELTDAAEQRRRLEREMAEKQRIYGERYPIDEDFLAALAQMPEASGIALGLRPAGDAGDRRRAHRSGAVDAGCRGVAGHDCHDDPLRLHAELGRARAGLPTIACGAGAVAARYAVAITPAMADLIDPHDPHDPIARQFVPDAART